MHLTANDLLPIQRAFAHHQRRLDRHAEPYTLEDFDLLASLGLIIAHFEGSLARHRSLTDLHAELVQASRVEEDPARRAELARVRARVGANAARLVPDPERVRVALSAEDRQVLRDALGELERQRALVYRDAADAIRRILHAA